MQRERPINESDRSAGPYHHYVSVLVLAAALVSCAGQFPFDQYDYTVDDLVLGVAFPPVQDEGGVASTVAAMSDLGLSWARISMDDLLSNYGPLIDRIQLGNEWNWEIDTYFGGDGDYRSGSEAAFIAYANILSNVDYEMLDIHFYDDFQDWELHLQALQTAWREAGHVGTIPVIVSEYGGPWGTSLYDEFGRPNQSDRAAALVDYVHALDSLDVEEVYFFKLRDSGADIEHPDSYLIDGGGRRTAAYKVMRRFGQAAAR